MSSWRDDLQRVTLADGRQVVAASFRGVPFFVDSADRAGGRRIVVHEFPLRDEPYVEDLGRRARVFPVDAYVLGDDYVRQRNRLLEALEDTAGPGELVHPYYGVRQAICSNLSVRESIGDGGMARLALEFTETSAAAPAPVGAVDLPTYVRVSVERAVAAVEDEFLLRYDDAGLPSFALASAQAALTSMSDALGEALAPVAQSTQELAQLDSQVRALTAQASALVRQPAVVLGSFLAAARSLTDAVASAPGAVFYAFLSTYAIDLGTPPLGTTATRDRERQNQDALQRALRRLVTIEAARLIVDVSFPTLDEALAARDTVAARLDEQAGTAEDTAYPALVDLRGNVIAAIPSEAVHARIVTVTRRVAVPSLALCYQLYGSVAQEADLLARNRVRHPGFLAGDLSVLSP